MYRVPTLSWFASGGGGSKDRPASLSAFTRFAGDERGNVAMMFGLMLTIMCLFTGAAVDLGQWMQARNQTQEAVDAAELAGLVEYQKSGDTTDAIAAAQATYDYITSNRPGSFTGSVSFAFVPGTGNTQMTVASDLAMKMPFLTLAHLDTLPILKIGDNSELAIAKMAVGANTGQSLEVSVMIDNTGSMCESAATVNTGRCGTPSKIETVIAAAKTLVDILVWSDQSSYTSKIAIVPFSYAVNLGPTMAAAARGVISAGASSTPGNMEYDISGRRGRFTPYFATPDCVTERVAADQYTDVSPIISPVGRLYTSSGDATNGGNCPTSAQLMPLTSNTAALKSLIGSMTAGGSTAGHIGTAWAWYALSPNFGTLWTLGGFSSSTARPYSDMHVLNAKGQPSLRKIAILMTDGDYNSQYCSGVGNWDGISCSGDNGSSNFQAGKLCTGMKAAGIEVYTIGAMVSTSAKAFLTSCATDASHYYDATDSNSLTLAFVNIAKTLVAPFLTH